MTDNKNWNTLIDDFLTDTQTVDDSLFVQNVMAALPPPPRWVWVADVFPAVVFFFTMITLWKFKVLTPSVLFAVVTKALIYLQILWQTVSPGSAITLLAGFFLMICYYAYETFIEI